MCRFIGSKIEKRTPGIKATIFLLCTYTLFCWSLAHAQNNKQQQGSRNMGVANATTALVGIEWSVFYNPALSVDSERSAGFYYSPAPFGLSELALIAAVYNEPSSVGTFSFGVSSSGFDLLRETGISLGYARSIERDIRLGVSVTYSSLSIKNYGSTGYFGIDAGVAVSLSPRLVLAGYIGNVNQPTIGTNAMEKRPMLFSIGAAHEVTDELLLLADIAKELDNEANVRVGVEYKPFPILAFRAGASTEPSRFAFGIGTQYLGLHFDYAALTHADLGLTHSISIAFHFDTYFPN